MYNKATLDNGLRIVSYNMPQMESVSLGLWIKAGGRYESKPQKGIAHFLEHILFKGSKKYSGKKIKQSLEGGGGSLNGFTSEEMTCYLVKIPCAYLNLALDILSDMVLNPLIALKEVQKERTVIMEEIKMHRDLPQSYVFELLDNLLWPNHPLGLDLAGTFESVGSLQRSDLAAFQKKFYKSPNMVVSCAGNLDHDNLVARASRLLGEKSVFRAQPFVKVKGTQEKSGLKILAKDTEQTHLALGFRSLKRDHPDRYALGLLHIILGANMSSRLFHEVREKRGLAYEIGTQVKRFYDSGAFLVHAGIDNKKVTTAISVILKELGKISSQLVSDDELKRAKEFYLGQFILALEDTLDHMLWIGETTLTLERAYSRDEIICALNQVTRQDLLRVAREIFKRKKANLALIGPVKGKEKDISQCFYS